MTAFPAIKAVLEAALLDGETATRKQAWREYEQARGFHLVACAYAGKAHQLEAEREALRGALQHVVDDFEFRDRDTAELAAEFVRSVLGSNEAQRADREERD